MAFLISAETSRLSEVLPKNPATGFTLDELYALLNCSTVEIVYLRNGTILIIDEDGKYTSKAKNALATGVAKALEGIRPDDYIVGDAIHADGHDIQ